MKKNYTIALLLFTIISLGQAGAPSTYYDGFNFNLTGADLKNALATKITSTHSKILSYSEAENAIKIVDLDPTDATNTNVLLLYGFANELCTYTSETSFGTSSNGDQHRRRHREADVSNVNNCAWNREHVYPKSLGTPNLGEVGAGADAHHLRTCDVARNANRGNSKFGPGTGNSAYFGAFWYPGDEWKGDVARNMMYMYLRYGSQCLPTGVGTGSVTASDANMIDLFLQWNAEDPVSPYEDNRNTYLGNTTNTYGQGNRNPFIDNPYLATVIWGGTAAQNRWPNMFLSSESYSFLSRVNVYPNPSNNKTLNIQSEKNIDSIELVNINGQLMQSIKNPIFQNNTYTLTNLSQGFYLLKLTSENQSTTKKVIVN